jgi:hypothetical protein
MILPSFLLIIRSAIRDRAACAKLQLLAVGALSGFANVAAYVLTTQAVFQDTGAKRRNLKVKHLLDELCCWCVQLQQNDERRGSAVVLYYRAGTKQVELERYCWPCLSSSVAFAGDNTTLTLAPRSNTVGGRRSRESWLAASVSDDSLGILALKNYHRERRTVSWRRKYGPA